jgi:hypothetical protein
MTGLTDLSLRDWHFNIYIWIHKLKAAKAGLSGEFFIYKRRFEAIFRLLTNGSAA